MMRDALLIVWYGLRDLWDELLFLMLLNLLWTVVAVLPVLPFFAFSRLDPVWILAMSLPLAAPVAVVSGALSYVANQITRGRAVGWETFRTGVRRYWAKSLAVAGVNLVVLLLFLVNLRFYSTAIQGEWAVLAIGLWLLAGLYWLLAQIFWFPMILELQNERLWLALRNALMMVIVTPGFTLVLAVALALLGGVLGFLAVPVATFLVSLFSLIANHATRSRLAFAQKKVYRPGESDR
jgi:hypothetical protein